MIVGKGSTYQKEATLEPNAKVGEGTNLAKA